MTRLRRAPGGRTALLGAAFLTLGTIAAASPGATASASASASASGFGKPVHPLRGPNGQPLRAQYAQLESSNWSGYVVTNYETGDTYTSAEGTWIVPAVTAAPGSSVSYSSSWVGIGGYCTDSTCSGVDSSLIQLGTEQDASSSGATNYAAWYEMLPNAPVSIPLSIAPGDSVTASLVAAPSSATASAADQAIQNAPGGGNGGGKGQGGGNGHGGGKGHGNSSGQSWTLSMTVSNSEGNSSWSTTVSYASSQLSAEWIEEAPTGCLGRSCSILPLANFGTATFDPSSVNNGGSPNLQSKQGVVMVNPNGQTSNPSRPDSDRDGFNACWGSDTLVHCSPPAS